MKGVWIELKKLAMSDDVDDLKLQTLNNMLEYYLMPSIQLAI